MAVRILLLVSSLASLTSGAAFAAPFTFEWSATVTQIEDGSGAPASMAGVGVGDELVASVTYDTDDFAAGVNVSGDGFDYAAPANLQMAYSFESGGSFVEDVTAVRARDGGAFDQWNWKGGGFGGLLFQANDFSDASWDLPIPSSFGAMHDLFLATRSNFEASAGNTFRVVTGDPLTSRIVRLGDPSFSIVPEPNAGLLLVSGLVWLLWGGRGKSAGTFRRARRSVPAGVGARASCSRPGGRHGLASAR